MEEQFLSYVPLTLSEAAEYLKVSTRVLRDWCNRKLIRYSRANYRRWYFRRSDLDAFLDRRTVIRKGCTRETKTKILAVVRGERSGDTRDGCFYSPPKSGYPGSQPTADLEKLAPPISESTPGLAIPIPLRCSDPFGVPRLRWRDFQIGPLQ